MHARCLCLLSFSVNYSCVQAPVSTLLPAIFKLKLIEFAILPSMGFTFGDYFAIIIYVFLNWEVAVLLLMAFYPWRLFCCHYSCGFKYP